MPDVADSGAWLQGDRDPDTGDPPPDRPGRPVPADRAVAIARSVARARGARHVVKHLGRIRPDRLARARARFASAMADDEVPLILVDTSFQRRGRAGFLLTNRALYSSRLPGPIALEDVETVRHRPPDHSVGLGEAVLTLLGCFVPLAHVLLLPLALRRGDRNWHALLVNDRVVYVGTGNLAWGFWEDVLPALRAELDGGAGRLRVAALEVLPGDAGAEPLRAAAPPWAAIERSVRALDGVALRAVRLWAGEPGRSACLEVAGGDGRYAVRLLPMGWTYHDPAGGDEGVEVCPGDRRPGREVCRDVEQVLAVAYAFAETGAFA